MRAIIIGLGNPGEKYERTRHNVGWRTVEHVAQKYRFSSWHDDKTCRAHVTEGVIAENEVALALPQTFMNQSGGAAACLQRKYGTDVPLVVVHDEIDLPRGTFRIAFGRGAGGHRGVESVAGALGGTDFARVRIGVSPTDTEGNIRKPESGEAVEKFVLENLSGADEEAFDAILPNLVDAVAMVVAEGHEEAMNRFNNRSHP